MVALPGPLDSHDQRLPRYFCPRPLSLQLHLCHFPGCRCARNVPRHLLEIGAEGANDALKPGETRRFFKVTGVREYVNQRLRGEYS